MEAHKPNPNSNIILDGLKAQSQFMPSEQLMISCGCVPVDPHARKIAILRQGPTIHLPKGRKNIGEDLLAAALRETYEETGVRFAALPLKVATRATPPAGMVVDGVDLGEKTGVDVGITASVANTEPVAVVSHPCHITGAFKVVVWFAAQGDSSEMPAEGTREAWEEDMVLEWVDAREAARMMTWKLDEMVIDKVLADMRRSGFDI